MPVKRFYIYIRVHDTPVCLYQTAGHISTHIRCMTHLYHCIRVNDTSVCLHQTAGHPRIQLGS